MPTSIPELITSASLERVVLNSIALEALRFDGSETTASITTRFEVGVKSPDPDAFFVSVSVEITGVEPKSAQTQYTANAKMTGFYQIGKRLEQNEIQEITTHAIERARLQVYPLVREILSNVLTKAGVNLSNFPLEVANPNKRAVAEVTPTAKPAAPAKTSGKRSASSKN
jgi:preprotein translocase subunit SecB